MKKQLHIRLDDDLEGAIRFIADKIGLSPQVYVLGIIRWALNRELDFLSLRSKIEWLEKGKLIKRCFEPNEGKQNASKSPRLRSSTKTSSRLPQTSK